MPRLVLAALAALALFAAPAHAGEWLAGDLHVHSTLSHDSYGGPGDDNTGPEEAYTFGFPVIGQFANAAARDLDFLAITDHNDVRSQDPAAGFGAFGVIGVPGYEKSLAGHAQMLGATRVYPEGDSDDPAYVQALADSLRADAGLFQVNHPVNSESDDPDDLDWALGYAVVPDTVEAWSSSRLYQPPFPASNSHDDAVRYWEGWLDRGERVALTGGSDTHWVSTSAVQGVGQPTTWVYAHDRTPAAVLEGLRAGRTSVSHQPPAFGGPRASVEVRRRGAWRQALGEAVAPRARLRVRVIGAPGAQLRLFGNGGRALRDLVVVTSPDFTQRLRAPRRISWLRAEVGHEDALEARREHCPPELGGSYCRNRILVLAMTSAVYVEPPRRRAETLRRARPGA